uniref:Secreted protein n=1 Tax=Arundo donax TaxID=35708 RepID=A0A0A9CRI9_ARUDO
MLVPLLISLMHILTILFWEFAAAVNNAAYVQGHRFGMTKSRCLSFRVHQMSSSWWMPMIPGNSSILWTLEGAIIFLQHGATPATYSLQFFQFCHQVCPDNMYHLLICSVKL